MQLDEQNLLFVLFHLKIMIVNQIYSFLCKISGLEMIKPISLIAISVAIFSCSAKRKAQSQQENDHLVPFIEYFIITEGEAIAGNVPLGRRIDGPGYSYDSVSQTLDIYRRSPADSVEALLYLGMGKILKGKAGQGVSSFVVPVTSIPFSVNDLTITSATKSKVSCLFQNEKFTLLPNQLHTFSKTRIDTLAGDAIVRTTTTWRFAFRGMVRKIR